VQIGIQFEMLRNSGELSQGERETAELRKKKLLNDLRYPRITKDTRTAISWGAHRDGERETD